MGAAQQPVAYGVRPGDLALAQLGASGTVMGEYAVDGLMRFGMPPEIMARYAVALVDVVSLALLKGSEIDFVDELAGAEFRVRNPNAKSSCGCGVSFSI